MRRLRVTAPRSSLVGIGRVHGRADSEAQESQSNDDSSHSEHVGCSNFGFGKGGPTKDQAGPETLYAFRLTYGKRRRKVGS